MEIFITGGTGFIGSYVVAELLNDGHHLTVLARNPQKAAGFIGNTAIRFVHGSLADQQLIAEGLAGKDACIHLALGWGETAVEMLEADTRPSLFILETAARLGVQHLIYTSSNMAIGEFEGIMNELTTPRPINFYGATKAATEAYLFAIALKYNIQCNIIRPGYTFGNPVVQGAPMEPDNSFRDIIKCAKQKTPIHMIKNDGAQFIWAGDLARLYSAVLNSTLNRRIFLGVGNDYVTWEEIADYAFKYTGYSSPIIFEDKGWTKDGSQFANLAMEKEFGFKFESGERLKEHIAYLANLNLEQL